MLMFVNSGVSVCVGVFMTTKCVCDSITRRIHQSLLKDCFVRMKTAVCLLNQVKSCYVRLSG